MSPEEGRGAQIIEKENNFSREKKSKNNFLNVNTWQNATGSPREPAPKKE
jgi:hypothetical protein